MLNHVLSSQMRSQMFEPIVTPHANRTLELAIASQVASALSALLANLDALVGYVGRSVSRYRRSATPVRLQGRVACRSERRRGAAQYWFAINCLVTHATWLVFWRKILQVDFESKIKHNHIQKTPSVKKAHSKKETETRICLYTEETSWVQFVFALRFV